MIRGRQTDDKTRTYLHRGIAARQFQRVFLLADGMQVAGADLVNGLLAVDVDPSRAASGASGASPSRRATERARSHRGSRARPHPKGENHADHANPTRSRL